MLPYFLAQANDDNIGRFIFPIIFVLIWIISAIMSAVNKSKDRQRRQQMEVEEHLGRQQPTAQRPPPLPDAILRQLPNPMPMPVPPQRQQQQRQQRPQPQSARRTPLPPQLPKKVQKKKKPAARPVQVFEEPAAPLRVSTPPIEAVQPIAARPAAATAASIQQWMKPSTLRQQFILTEILQPPKALRPDQERM
ncbi:MAG TPA: hypothetical protein VGN72_09285 [Tepidisphaeraceae bacterium]|jgi:hypothetical protein|nr:hypothetical protein [Tepidisphaeraceae bacterium]